MKRSSFTVAVLAAALTLSAVPAEAGWNNFCTRLYGKNYSATKVKTTISRTDGTVQKSTKWAPGERAHFKFCWDGCSKRQKTRKFSIEELQTKSVIANGQITWKVNENGRCKVSYYVDSFTDTAGDDFTVTWDTINASDSHNSKYVIIKVK